MPEPLPHEAETLEVVTTAARIVFGETVSEDQYVERQTLMYPEKIETFRR